MIFYPHRVEIVRRTPSAAEDAWGRPIPGATVTVATSTAWIQAASQTEQTQLDEAGAVRNEYTVFLPAPAVGLSEGDALRTLESGGQTAGILHQIVGIEDPDGTGHHLEVRTVVIEDVAATLIS